MGTDEDTATCSEPYIGPQLYNAASVGAYSCVGPESTAPSATQTAPGKLLVFNILVFVTVEIATSFNVLLFTDFSYNMLRGFSSSWTTVTAIDIHAPVSRLQQCSVRELNQLVTKLHLVRPVGAVERADLLALVLGERVRLRDLQARCVKLIFCIM